MGEYRVSGWGIGFSNLQTLFIRSLARYAFARQLGSQFGAAEASLGLLVARQRFVDQSASAKGQLAMWLIKHFEPRNELLTIEVRYRDRICAS